MPDSYYTLIQEGPEDVVLRAGPATVGPWSPGAQHGGPPCALAVTLADRLVRSATARSDLAAVRLGADFLAPVPVGVVTAEVRLVRSARTAALAEVVLSADGRPCLLARVWFVRTSDTSQLSGPLPEPTEVPDLPAGNDSSFGYADSLEWRYARGSMRTPGPGAVWVRVALPLVENWPVPGLARVALVADSASGISAELDWEVWSFVNVDLDIHLARPFIGEWVFIDAATQLGRDGSALARSMISDVHGVAGTGLQTLVLAPLNR